MTEMCIAVVPLTWLLGPLKNEIADSVVKTFPLVSKQCALYGTTH